MNAINQDKTPDVDAGNNFDVLCQGFDNGNFYGLEYILDDFFQNTKIKPSAPVQNYIDWFGLNS